MDESVKEKLLEKILELFTSMPDKDDDLAGAPKEGEVQIVGVGAKPLDDKKGIL